MSIVIVTRQRYNRLLGIFYFIADVVGSSLSTLSLGTTDDSPHAVTIYTLHSGSTIFSGGFLSVLSLGFYRAMHFSAKRGIAIACRLSVRLSVCDVGEL